MNISPSLLLRNRLKNSIDIINSLNDEFYNKVTLFCELSLQCLKKKGKIITFGNGGSASDAIHLTGELVGKFMLTRNPINSICLNTNISVITSIANDLDYENIFLRQLEAHTADNDIVLAISTSGTSKNITKCFNFFNKYKINCFLFTGNKVVLNENYIKSINVPSSSVDKIQEIFFFFMHSYCEYLEKILYNNVK